MYKPLYGLGMKSLESYVRSIPAPKLLMFSPQAAVCIYDTGRVAHAQYIATTTLGRELDLLTPLIDYLINEIYTSHPYFDFGISNENGGQYLNRGLLRHKASFGATGVAYNRYFLDLA